MQPDVLDRLPTLDEVERAISLRSRENRLLRTLRDALRRRQAQERAVDHHGRRRDQGGRADA